MCPWFVLVALLLLARATRAQMGCDANCQSPRRPPTEAAFNAINHHERSATLAEMNAKLAAIRKRRQQAAWSTANPAVKAALSQHTQLANRTRMPNILLILADDLGYGDLSVHPFTERKTADWPCSEGGILTPHLERMARNGAVMTNFHSAAPVCSPSRVAVLTGLYPWRLGALNAFELGQDLSQRNGFLPQYSTGPEILRGAGYYTAHSGKWHLGGMREEMRVRRARADDCTRPGPNQAGFERYISELDGPESGRYTFLLRNAILHSQGYKHLLEDDVPVPILERPPAPYSHSVLSDREAGDAADMMRALQATSPEQPWFIEVWFNAPHGPWELLPSALPVYSRHHNTSASHWASKTCREGRGEEEKLTAQRRFQYKTMVTAMDASIGMLLDTIEQLGIDDNTLVVFTSDNGPEVGAGTAGIYREGKRSLLEGGIRVPAIWQWKTHITAGSIAPQWAATVDLFPTFLEAAGIARPEGLRWDGVSAWGALQAALPWGPASTHVTRDGHEIRGRHHHSHHHSHNDTATAATGAAAGTGISNNNTNSGSDGGTPRLFLWHKDTERFNDQQDRYQSSGLYDDVKVTTTGRMGCLDRIFDLRHDPTEQRNLVKPERPCLVNFDAHAPELVGRVVDAAAFSAHCGDPSASAAASAGATAGAAGAAGATAGAGGVNAGGLSAAGPKAEASNAARRHQACLEKYRHRVTQAVAAVLPKLTAFVRHGDRPMRQYLGREGAGQPRTACAVPTYGESQKIVWESAAECAASGKCSVPEH